jgi:peptide/nickel transport system permease protein
LAELTPAQRTWKAFKRNKFAVVGLAFIIVVSAIAVLGYLIMPDDTPLANNQTIQLSLKKPGSTFMMLRLKKPEHVDTLSFLSKIWYGQPAVYTDVPIVNYRFVKDSILVNEYIGDEDKPEIRAYNIVEVVTGTKPVRPPHSDVSSNTRFYDEIKLHHITQKTFWLGTDIYGRDILSRLILGARISLSVGIMAVIISLLIGVTIGALAGYFGGWIDGALSWLMNILWSLPALLLVLAISFALGKGLWQIYIAMWVEVARLVRGQVISVKQTEYIEAARALGYGNTRIIIRHILPNITGPILVMASSNFASAILLEAGLSFLGFGAQPPTPTWGGMIREHYGYIIMDAAYLSIIPGLAIMLIVYAFNLVTVALRDAFDIKSQNTRV